VSREVAWPLFLPCAVLAVLVAAWLARPDWFAVIEESPDPS
jgi:hypothetical protein